MNAAIYPALFFTVAMLVTTAYFLMGGLPLLVLSHDTPLDARFVRGYFNVYYRAALFTALGACVSYAAWGRWPFAAGAAAFALVAVQLRRRLLPAMEEIGARIAAPSGADATALRRFRQVHGFALSVNLVQLVVLVGALTQLSL